MRFISRPALPSTETPTVGNDDAAANRRGANGELLIEVVLAVAIIGTAVVGLVAALGAALGLSSPSRTDARGDLLLVRYAEALTAAPYEPCSTHTPPYLDAAVTAIPSTGLPAGVAAGPPGSGDGTARTFELSVESTGSWAGDTSPATFAPDCAGVDRGSELLQLRVRSGDGAFDRRLAIVKRAA